VCKTCFGLNSSSSLLECVLGCVEPMALPRYCENVYDTSILASIISLLAVQPPKASNTIDHTSKQFQIFENRTVLVGTDHTMILIFGCPIQRQATTIHDT
jgi:hypothetical protein